MEFSKLFLIPFFLFCTIMAEREGSCDPRSSAIMCYDGIIIQFPFSYSSGCAYPGFNISCDGMNPTVIQIGSWGEFSVKHVNYRSQKVQIHDQDNCLPRRLLNLDLSDSPFRGDHYENFTFYNCSSAFSSNNSEPIHCLSSINHTIYATPSPDTEREMIRTCDLIKSVMVPSRWINRAIDLTWEKPDCRACLRRWGMCGFKDSKSSEISCFYSLSPPHHGSSSLKYIIAVGVCGPAIICFIVVACSASRRSRQLGQAESSTPAMQQHPIISMVGLDESVIQSYPTNVLGGSRRFLNPEDTVCSICLSEYQPKETLKTIPECKHYFHAPCIDEWLRKNVTCPICRKSPTHLPSLSSSLP